MSDDATSDLSATLAIVDRRRPLIAGLISLVVLGIALGSVVVFVEFPSENLPELAFFLAGTIAILIAKAVYDVVLLERAFRVEIARKVEKAIRPHSLLFAQVFEHSPIAYVVTDRTGKVLTYNAAALRLSGESAETIGQRSLFNLFKTEVAEHQDVLVEKIVKGVSVTDESVSFVSGEATLWAQLSALHFESEHGQPQILFVILDVTRMKQVDIAKSEFVSLASHQLRTPLAGMRWSAELLLMDGAETLTEQQQKYINRLLSSIERMNHLVDDFLNVSRFELGTRTTEFTPGSPRQMFDEILRDHMVTATSKHITVETEFAPDVSMMTTDWGLLRMVVTNLFTNAVKYTNQGGKVAVRYRTEGENVVITVDDTGIGIPVNDQPRIFTKIYRATNALKEVPDGTGLGLYIAKRAVIALGGRLTFTSVEGEGSQFMVVVPIHS